MDAAYIGECMEAKGYTVTKTTQLARIQRPSWYPILEGKKGVGIDKVLRLAVVLDLDLNRLFAQELEMIRTQVEGEVRFLSKDT